MDNDVRDLMMDSQDLEKQFNTFIDAWMDGSQLAPFAHEDAAQSMATSAPGTSVPPFESPVDHQQQGQTPIGADILVDTPFYEPTSHSHAQRAENFSGTAVSGRSRSAASALTGPLMAVAHRLGSSPPPTEEEASVDIQQQRKNKILEKNRRAQKRFREKQKVKMTEMEAQLQTMQKDMASLIEEKVCLKRQNEVRLCFHDRGMARSLINYRLSRASRPRGSKRIKCLDDASSNVSNSLDLLFVSRCN
jgi:hypothetical protein